MDPKEQTRFYELYQENLQASKLHGYARKTVEAYSRALQRAVERTEKSPNRLTPHELRAFSQGWWKLFEHQANMHRSVYAKISRLLPICPEFESCQFFEQPLPGIQDTTEMQTPIPGMESDPESLPPDLERSRDDSLVTHETQLWSYTYTYTYRTNARNQAFARSGVEDSSIRQNVAAPWANSDPGSVMSRL